jgi:hypothetical protein
MAFNPENKTQVGTKGSDVYTAAGVEDPRVALSVLLTRGADAKVIQDGLAAILKMGGQEPLEDAFLLTFQTRDVRGGKGERDLSEEMWRSLLANPKTSAYARDLLALVPHYGSWRDLFQLADVEKVLARPRVLDLAVNQLVEDEKAVALKQSASLLAKWIPREDRQGDQAKELAKRLFPGEERISRRLAAYRKRISALNKALNTVEVKMCGGDWEEIEPGKVPGRAVKKYTKAFLNEAVPTKKGERVPAGLLRHPGDEVRMACREHFQSHFAKAAKGEAKVHGADTVFPHELIKKIVAAQGLGHDSYAPIRRMVQMQSWQPSLYELPDGHPASYPTMSEEEKNSIRGMWRGMVQKAREGGGLGRSLAMCDFSGSMQSSGTNGDTPYWVSMALGLLISEVTTEEFKDTFLTFDSQPKLHKLPATEDIFARVGAIAPSLGQGTSTDFQKAMDLVLAQLKAKRCRPGQEPENLIVLTDMNWDAACASNQRGYYTGNSYRHHVKTGSWQTHVEMIRESFKRAGEDMWGSEADGGLGGWKMPTIVIWNIAATSADFHAKADTEGVVMLGGWSPSLFKVLQTEGVVQWTPYQALRAQLDDERYDLVRERLRKLLDPYRDLPMNVGC